MGGLSTDIGSAMALYEQYKREEEARKAAEAQSAATPDLYHRIRPEVGDSTAQAVAALEGAFQGGMEGVGNIGHVLTTPARLIAGAATKGAVPGGPDFSVLDYTLHGAASGAPVAQYGDLLAGTLEDSGELAPGGFASKLVRLLGNLVTDPVAAPGLIGSAEAAGALAGGVAPAEGAAAAPSAIARAPRSRLQPQYREPPPAAGPQALAQRPPGPMTGPNATQRIPPPKPVGGGMTVAASRAKYPELATQKVPMVKQGPPGPDATQPVRTVGPKGPGPNPTETQPVRTIKPQGSSIEAKYAAKKGEWGAEAPPKPKAKPKHRHKKPKKED